MYHVAVLQSCKTAELPWCVGAGSVVGEGLRASEGHTSAHLLQYGICGDVGVVCGMHHGTIVPSYQRSGYQ